MAERKAFLLRLPVDLFDDLQYWARDDLRSLNAQIEYVLRDALRRRERSKIPADPDAAAGPLTNDNVPPPPGGEDAGEVDSS